MVSHGYAETFSASGRNEIFSGDHGLKPRHQENYRQNACFVTDSSPRRRLSQGTHLRRAGLPIRRNEREIGTQSTTARSLRNHHAMVNLTGRRLDFSAAPKRVCLLRLSAIGDTCHVVPLLHRLRRAWPDTQFTWVIGRREAPLMAQLPGVRFVVFDKRAQGVGGRGLLAALAAEKFDLLLHLQVALRASRLAWRIHAPVKLGFDWKRGRDAQWLFTTDRIAARILLKVPRENSGIPARYSSTFLGAILLFDAARRLGEFFFFISAMPRRP